MKQSDSLCLFKKIDNLIAVVVVIVFVVIFIDYQGESINYQFKFILISTKSRSTDWLSSGFFVGLLALYDELMTLSKSARYRKQFTRLKHVALYFRFRCVGPTCGG